MFCIFNKIQYKIPAKIKLNPLAGKLSVKGMLLPDYAGKVFSNKFYFYYI